MGVPTHLRPIAHDAAAADEVLHRARALAVTLAHVAQHRDGRVEAARADWQGPARRDFDLADADLRRAMRLTADLLAELRTGIAADLAAIESANRRRAAARARWLEARCPPPVTSSPGRLPGGVR